MASTSSGRKGRAIRGRRRLAPGERRQDLLRTAGRLLTRDGVDGVQFAQVAAATGVTRQLVYRFFPSRQALIMAVLEDFADTLTERFGRHAIRSLPTSLDEATRLFVEAACDTIAARGAGAWHLLDSKGPDPEVARLGRLIRARLEAPWHARIAQATGATPRDVATIARMVVAAVRAVLDRWCAGEITRAAAVRDGARGVAALLAAFSRRPAAGDGRRRTARR